MKKISLIAGLLLAGSQVHAQDVHFSQFWNNAIQYNPAMTGIIPANLRLVASYRTQWASVASPYKTFAFNGDTRFEPRNSSVSIGAGLSAYKDVAGDTEFGTTHILFSLSGILELDRNNKLSVGANGGFLQKSLNPSALQWGNQYQGGSFNSALDPGETMNMNPGFKGDVSVGICYVYHSNENYMTANDQFAVKVGFAVNHLTKPKHEWTSLYTDTLYHNIVSHGEVTVGIGNSRLTVIPGYLAMFQGPSREITVGSLFRYRLQEASKVTGYVKGAYLTLGTYVRLGDAFIPSVAIDFDKYSIGFSYDTNISQLRTASRGNGGFEISLKFRTPNPYLWKGSMASFR